MLCSVINQYDGVFAGMTERVNELFEEREFIKR
jgi:hypothetical protein